MAPHPDDEALAGSALLQSAPADAWVLYLTAGDGHRRAAAALTGHPDPGPADYLALGRARLADSRRAAAALGIPPGQLLYLGFPDSALAAVLHADRPVTSPTTHAAAVPYAGTLDPSAPYTRAALLQLLHQVAGMVDPDGLIAPAPADSHPDHRATADVAGLLAPAPPGPWLDYLVHHDLYPWPWGYHPDRILNPPPTLLPDRRLEVPQTAAAEARQLAAIRAYRTEWRVDRAWLESFVARLQPYGVVR